MLHALEDAIKIVKEEMNAKEVIQIVGDQAYYDLYTRPENLNDVNAIINIGWLHFSHYVDHSNMNSILDVGGFEILAAIFNIHFHRSDIIFS